MSKKSRKKKADQEHIVTDRREIHVGGSYVEGDVIAEEFVGRDKTVRKDSHDQLTLTYLFAPIYQQIENRPDTSEEERADITEVVQEIEKEAAKGKGVDETFLENRLRNLKAMAGDIFEVVVAALGGPASVISTMIAKIRGRIEAESTEF